MFDGRMILNPFTITGVSGQDSSTCGPLPEAMESPADEEPRRLSELLEADRAVRNRSRKHGVLTCWPNKNTVGLASMASCKLTARVLELAAEWWTQQQDGPCCILINDVRKEAARLKTSLNFFIRSFVVKWIKDVRKSGPH